MWLDSDALTQLIDLEQLAPFREIGRYPLIWHEPSSLSLGLVVVYEAEHGQRVHVVHSLGYELGGGMEVQGEHIGAAVRRDPQAVGLLLSWPSNGSRDSPEGGLFETDPDELIRVWFDPVAESVLRQQRTCSYGRMNYVDSRETAAVWSSRLGCEVRRLSTSEAAAEVERLAPGIVAHVQGRPGQRPSDRT